MSVTQDFNEQNYINGSLVAMTKNNVDVPHTGRIPLVAGTDTSVYTFYATRTATNVTTGQSEYDTALIIN